MPITRHRSGQWLYQFNRVINGQRTRANKTLPPGWTKKQADEFDRIESARLYAVATGVIKTQPLIEDAVLLYLNQHAPGLKNRVALEQSLALVHSYYTGKPMAALPDICRAYSADHVLTLAAGTIRNRLAYLRAACRWAWKNHNMGDHDPAERVILPKVRNARNVFFDRAMMLKIARNMHNHTSRAAFRVAFYTGWRISEILRAKAVITKERATLTIADSKNGTPRSVPVHPRIAHLMRRPAKKPPIHRKVLRLTWPLNIRADTVSHHVKAAMRAAGIGHARLHDARHSAASEMINAGVDLYTVGGVLGHKSAVSTQRYSHLATAKLQAAISTIGKKVQPALKTKSTKPRKIATK